MSTSPVIGDMPSDRVDEPDVPSAVLYSSPPASAVFASMPSESVAADASEQVAALFVPPVARNSPSYEVIVSRDHSPNHG